MPILKEDANRITDAASRIKTIAGLVKTKVPVPDDGGSAGSSKEELASAVEALEKSLTSLKELMEKTVVFLETKGAKIEEIDMKEAQKYYEDRGFSFKSKQP